VRTKFVFQCDLCGLLGEQAPYRRKEDNETLQAIRNTLTATII
jgi:hypothetical protein